MSGLEAMIRSMEKKLGMGEPNSVQSWYRSRNGSAYSGNFAWCDALVTWAAVDSGNYDAVCFGTDYAYTVSHAQRFNSHGQWHAMNHGIQGTGIRRGDIIFFDWAGSWSIGAIDHVGIVTDVKGDKVYTIEGNTSNVCARRVRYVADIAGFGRPKYTSGGGGGDSSSVARYKVTINGLEYGYGAHGAQVTAVGKALVDAGFGKHYKEGPGPTWSDADTENYSDYQKSLGYKDTSPHGDADGVPGSGSLKKLMGGRLPSKSDPNGGWVANKPEPPKERTLEWQKVEGYMPELRYGDENWYVDWLQRNLNRFISPNIKVDGKYGNATAAAVDKFYKEKLNYNTTTDGHVFSKGGWQRVLSLAANDKGEAYKIPLRDRAVRKFRREEKGVKPVLFVKRLAEEALHAAIAAGCAVLATGDLSKAGLVAAGAAAVRAIIGVVVKAFGDKDKPSVS